MPWIAEHPDIFKPCKYLMPGHYSRSKEKSSLDSTNRGPVGASRSSGMFIVIPLSSNRCLAMSDDKLYAKSRAACEGRNMEKDLDLQHAKSHMNESRISRAIRRQRLKSPIIASISEKNWKNSGFPAPSRSATELISNK